MSKFAPMLAERESAHNFFDELVFPLYASPKLDGIRCVVRDGQAQTRSLNAVANGYVRDILSNAALSGLDGELIVGSPNAENCYNATQCVLGNRVPEPAFTFYVFDDFSEPSLVYEERIQKAYARVRALEHVGFRTTVAYWTAEPMESIDTLIAFEAKCLEMGYEGVILRSALGAYKYGRSTRKQQAMLKLKRFQDFEFEVTGFEELMRNGNEDVRDNLGHAKRSSAQAGLVPGGTLGVIVGKITDPGATKFEIGTPVRLGMFKGLTSDDKLEIWNNQAAYLGRIGKASCFAVGAVDLPRHAKFIGWRDKEDMS